MSRKFFDLRLLKELENIIKYKFKKIDNLALALTHSSYANEKQHLGISSNERIEFLGDSVLNITISEYLYNKYKKSPEGELTKSRANIVCEPSLAKCAREIGLGEYLLLGKGEEAGGGRNRDSLLSDAFEALIGAIYIDSSKDDAKKFILRFMKSILEDMETGKINDDYKTSLQEKLQENGDIEIKYSVIKEIGPDHKKLFISEITADKVRIGTGEGKSKKQSEQNAAKEALKRIAKQEGHDDN